MNDDPAMNGHQAPSPSMVLADQTLVDGRMLTTDRERMVCGRKFIGLLVNMPELEQEMYLKKGTKVFDFTMPVGRQALEEMCADHVLTPALEEFIEWSDSISTRSPQRDVEDIELLAQVRLLSRKLAAIEDATARELGRQRAVKILQENLKVKKADFLIQEALTSARSLRARPDMDPDPWPDPVDGGVLLDAIKAAYQRYIVFSEEAAVSVSLYTLLTHVYDCFDILPNLRIKSPIKRCGKTRVLEIAEGLVRRPMLASNASAAAIYRGVELWHPTLLLDEVDTFLTGGPKTQSHVDLQNVVNSGHTRSTAWVLRTAGENRDEPRRYSTWAPKVLASIGDLPDTIEDRSIIVGMRRKLAHEGATRWRNAYMTQLVPIQRQAARWAADNLETLRGVDPVVPEGLNDRQQDCWRPLLAIADLAGGDWPRAARAAAQMLSEAAGEETAPVGQKLLSDIREVFYSTTPHLERTSSRDLIAALCNLPENPWLVRYRGLPLNERDVAGLLEPFGVKSQNVRTKEPTTLVTAPGEPVTYTEHVRKGYTLQSLHDAFNRYLPERKPSP